ncbi:MAG: hypothetical protein ABEJ72_05710, partial [Candidatus Aenigmatarchaeota archaeon]
SPVWNSDGNESRQSVVEKSFNWTAGNFPDISLLSLNTTLELNEKGWINVTVNVSNQGLGAWKPNVTIRKVVPDNIDRSTS